jgi:hypothetical protein
VRPESIASTISQLTATLGRAGGFCFAPAQVDVWRRAVAGGAGQLQRVLPGHTRLQSACELIKQKICFAMQTLVYELAYSATASATWR